MGTRETGKLLQSQIQFNVDILKEVGTHMMGVNWKYIKSETKSPIHVFVLLVMKLVLLLEILF